MELFQLVTFVRRGAATKRPVALDGIVPFRLSVWMDCRWDFAWVHWRHGRSAIHVCPTKAANECFVVHTRQLIREKSTFPFK